MSKFLKSFILATIIASPVLAGDKYGIGREATHAEISAWNTDVSPNGDGLPVGSGTVDDGDELYQKYCAYCHGVFAEGAGAWPVLAGGEDTLEDFRPVKTVGSYWPYLSTVFDYIKRSMPFGQAGILTDDQTYAITAYVLYSNDLIDDDFVLSNETFFDVEMPNAEGFILDPRETEEYPIFNRTDSICMTDCRDTEVKVTRKASDINVTPED